jgi:hypothetical protein
MAIDDTPREVVTAPRRDYTVPLAIVFVVLLLLVVGQFYTMSKIGNLSRNLDAATAAGAKTRSDLSAKMDDQLSSMEKSNAQGLQELKAQVDSSARRMGMTQGELRRARASVVKISKLQQEQQQEAEALKGQLASKADQQQVGALTQDVSATKSDLGTTKRTVDTLTKDLGMARSELGTLIARNHDDIETLRKLGERDYFEFTLDKNIRKDVAGVGLILKKADPKRSKYNLVLLSNDKEIRKDNRTVDEPIFFTPGGTKKFYELVVIKVDSKSGISGYVSTPKGFVQTETAERAEGRS